MNPRAYGSAPYGESSNFFPVRNGTIVREPGGLAPGAVQIPNLSSIKVRAPLCAGATTRCSCKAHLDKCTSQNKPPPCSWGITEVKVRGGARLGARGKARVALYDHLVSLRCAHFIFPPGSRR